MALGRGSGASVEVLTVLRARLSGAGRSWSGQARETYQAEIRKLENEKAELEARKRQLEEANRPPEKKSPKKKSGIFG